jgi:hypothetical protein
LTALFVLSIDPVLRVFLVSTVCVCLAQFLYQSVPDDIGLQACRILFCHVG